MRFILLCMLGACGRDEVQARVNAFKGSWSGVAYTSNLGDLFEAAASFSEERIEWRVNKQPGAEDFLVAEGTYRTTDAGVLVMTLDNARFERTDGGETLAREGSCFVDTEGTCWIERQQSSSYVVSALNVQFNVGVGNATVVINVNRNL